jgi:site-specific DNA-methyltransferase (adenine-specific)/modification methylase
MGAGRDVGMSFEVVQIGDATLYCGDCMEVLPTLGKVDACITDPPYGINAGHGIGRSDRLRVGRNRLDWDSEPFEVTEEFLGVADHYVIWGGNYFKLPPTRGFLVWDKNNSGRDFADCEFAWTNQDANARMKTRRPMNMDGGKVHPTQKPVDIMMWCISYLPYCETILDPFMGSGSTGVAAIQLGRKFIGIERDPNYFAIAVDRIKRAVAQGQLFQPEPPKQEQQDIFGEAA